MSTDDINDEITGRGEHDNGARLDVRIGPYTGPAGIEKTAEGTLRAAFFAELTRDLRAAKGSTGDVGGARCTVLSVERFDPVPGMVIATVLPAAENPAEPENT